MATVPAVNFTLDSLAFSQALASARELLEARPEFVEFFFSLFDSAAEIGSFELKPTTGANLTIFLKPSDCLLDFLAALRAVDRKVRGDENTHD